LAGEGQGDGLGGTRVWFGALVWWGGAAGGGRRRHTAAAAAAVSTAARPWPVRTGGEARLLPQGLEHAEKANWFKDFGSPPELAAAGSQGAGAARVRRGSGWAWRPRAGGHDGLK
jgi:hypothetical protein